MSKVSDKSRLAWLILLGMMLICHLPVMEVNAENEQKKGSWRKEEEDWFYFDENGLMKNGWIWTGEYWYFLNPDNNGVFGRMMTGWQWIDGRCYYLAVNSGVNYPEGAMYRNDLTPDGYSVDASGAWLDESVIVEVPAKGIHTAVYSKVTSVNKKNSGSSFGGGGFRGRGSADSSSPKREEYSGEIKAPGIEVEQYRYTVHYRDIADNTILKVVAGIGGREETIINLLPGLEGYEPCKGQKESFYLTDDNMILNIYYEKYIQASPSEAKKVDWNIYFIEQGNPNNKVFKSQHGQTEEGTELVIDFPEKIIGLDRYYYHSLAKSPWSVIVNGSGIQKYYIEYQKGESLPEETDPVEEVKDKLKKWLEIARNGDIKLTGKGPSDQQIITENIGESNERLLYLVSMTDSADRQEVYLIAKGHTPNTLTMSQTFQNVINISELVREEFTIADEQYTIMCVGFEKTFAKNICSHDYEITDKVSAKCTVNSYETVKCQKCGKEEITILPATGHTDGDYDGYCDFCYERADGVPEAVHYSIGDVQARIIGEKIYLFRCIDDDYKDAMDNSQQSALFLCDSVIRSDIDGVSKKLIFGVNNNYKNSNIRKWLLSKAEDDKFVHETYIGITKSYIGATNKGTYEQFNDCSLMGLPRMFQLLKDKVFILSVDEALNYGEYLWKFNGSETNNPESQISPYSRGYYLRTPQDGGLNDFWYGDGIYAVNLVDGNIQPVDVTETSIGIRPVMAIPQR